jgi:hypothetical protein
MKHRLDLIVVKEKHYNKYQHGSNLKVAKEEIHEENKMVQI